MSREPIIRNMRVVNTKLTENELKMFKEVRQHTMFNIRLYYARDFDILSIALRFCNSQSKLFFTSDRTDIRAVSSHLYVNNVCLCASAPRDFETK